MGKLADFGMSRMLSSEGVLENQSDSLTVTWCALSSAHLLQPVCSPLHVHKPSTHTHAWQSHWILCVLELGWEALNSLQNLLQADAVAVRRAAPEQRLGAPVSEKVDIHAFGVGSCLCALLCALLILNCLLLHS